MQININFNGKAFLLIAAAVGFLALGAHGIEEINNARQVENLFEIIHHAANNDSAKGLSAMGTLALQLALQTLGIANEISPQIMENLASNAQRTKQIGILILMIAIVGFCGTCYLAMRIFKKPAAELKEAALPH